MDPRSYNPDAPGPWADELPDTLRAAVGQLRDERPPIDAAHRVLARARLTPPSPPPPLPRPRPWISSRFSLAIAGAIAAGLLAYLVWRPGAAVVVNRGHEPTRIVFVKHVPEGKSPFGAHGFAKPSVVV